MCVFFMSVIKKKEKPWSSESLFIKTPLALVPLLFYGLPVDFGFVFFWHHTIISAVLLSRSRVRYRLQPMVLCVISASITLKSPHYLPPAVCRSHNLRLMTLLSRPCVKFVQSACHVDGILTVCVQFKLGMSFWPAPP